MRGKGNKKERTNHKTTKMLTGNINVISSPSGFKKFLICCAHADLISGSMAQKNLHIQLDCNDQEVFVMG